MSGYDRGASNSLSFSVDVLNAGPINNRTFGSAVNWPTANLAIYVPVVVERRIVVKKMWFSNWTTAAGNYDIGIYDAAGTRLLSRGSTSKTSSSEEVIWDCTDTTIGPGIYYLAMAMSSTSDQFLGASVSPAPLATVCGVLTEASALPLPATATFALSHALLAVPAIGMFASAVPT